MSPLGHLLFSLGFAGAGVFIIISGLRLIAEARASRSWPAVDGVVIHSEVIGKLETRSRGGKRGGSYQHQAYVADITYHYNMAGVTYHGSRIGVSDGSHTRHAAAMNAAARYPKGAKVTVRYRQDKPDVCLLEPGASTKTWATLLFGAIFLAAGVLIYLFVPTTR